MFIQSISRYSQYALAKTLMEGHIFVMRVNAMTKLYVYAMQKHYLCRMHYRQQLTASSCCYSQVQGHHI